MKRRTKIVLAAVVVIGIATSAAVAHRGNFAERVADHISADLDLTGNQKTELYDVIEQLSGLRNTLADERTETRNQLLAMLDQPAVDSQQLIDLVSEKLRKVESNTPTVAIAIAGFINGMNDEQKALLREKLERKQRWSRH